MANASSSLFCSSQKRYGFGPEAFDTSRLPDFDREFLEPEHLEAFARALQGPNDGLQSPHDETTPSNNTTGPRSSGYFGITKRASQIPEDGPSSVQVAASAAAAGGQLMIAEEPQRDGGGSQVAARRRNHERTPSQQLTFIAAQSDWAPINQKVKKPTSGAGAKRGSGKRRRRPAVGVRTKDETREGYLYTIVKWPLLLLVATVLAGEWLAYLLTRLYIYSYEQMVAWRGKRASLRGNMRHAASYDDWVGAARELDGFLGRQAWKEENEFAYYDSDTVRRVWDHMRRARARAEAAEDEPEDMTPGKKPSPAEDLKALLEASVKNNFVGVENKRLYSQTYYGTKNLVQNFVDETETSVQFALSTKRLGPEAKRSLFKRMHSNYGRTALCLSGGATFAYYHLGVVKALLDANLLPDVITGTSGGALVAALVATRTNEELKQLLVPALAHRITACRESPLIWLPRWWRTGARFDSVDWARLSSWWTRGSMTFREAYQRTGRILNVTCVPSDPHSPTILCNYLTSPDCVIWSAVLASAAVPGILNPVVLMMKTRDGSLVPYSFGHKWKDGSLRTDIPIKALHLHFNVNFTIVSQVNPHINLFFFSSRGTVGHPVTHRKGRGWRGGYVMSAIENYLKLDMTKWLRFIRHAELLPRPLGQDWSQLWLQDAFAGTITIWPKSIPSDFWHILSDPEPARLARMLHDGQQSTFPKLKFVANRLKIERLVERGRLESKPWARRGSIETILSEDEVANLLVQAHHAGAAGTGSGGGGSGGGTMTTDEGDDTEGGVLTDDGEYYAPVDRKAAAEVEDAMGLDESLEDSAGHLKSE